MMDKDHKEKAELIFSHTSMMLTETGNIYPTFIMIIDGQLRPVVVGNNEEISTSQYKEVVYQAIKEQQPEAVMFICEQWMVLRDKDDPQTQLLVDNVIRTEDQIDKESYLTLTYTKPSGDNEALIAKIELDLIGTPYTKTQSWIKDFIPGIIEK